jgi:hypothetical protein
VAAVLAKVKGFIDFSRPPVNSFDLIVQAHLADDSRPVPAVKTLDVVRSCPAIGAARANVWKGKTERVAK